METEYYIEMSFGDEDDKWLKLTHSKTDEEEVITLLRYYRKSCMGNGNNQYRMIKTNPSVWITEDQEI